jgi:hypothetical protein
MYTIIYGWIMELDEQLQDTNNDKKEVESASFAKWSNWCWFPL